LPGVFETCTTALYNLDKNKIQIPTVSIYLSLNTKAGKAQQLKILQTGLLVTGKKMDSKSLTYRIITSRQK